MDPIAEAERVAYYPIRSPIDGTVIAVDATLSQHVDEKTEMIQVADLSCVWLRADVFEKDLGTIRRASGTTGDLSRDQLSWAAVHGRHFLARRPR